MLKGLKTISQDGIKELIEKRIQNPEKYIDKPLIIWRTGFKDGIQERIVKDAFDEFNQDKTKETRRWYLDTILGIGTPQTYNLTDASVIRDNVEEDKYGIYKKGLLAVCPIMVGYDYKVNPASLNQYQSLINKREWEGLKVADGVPIVAYMSLTSDWFETPEAYPNAEQYIFEPDFEKWVKWANETDYLPQFIIDFIRGDNSKDGITFRWYNSFRNLNPGPEMERRGCLCPIRWRQAFIRLCDKLDDQKLDKFSDLDYEDFRLAIPAGIAPDLWDEFYRYVKEKNV